MQVSSSGLALRSCSWARCSTTERQLSRLPLAGFVASSRTLASLSYTTQRLSLFLHWLVEVPLVERPLLRRTRSTMWADQRKQLPPPQLLLPLHWHCLKPQQRPQLQPPCSPAADRWQSLLLSLILLLLRLLMERLP